MIPSKWYMRIVLSDGAMLTCKRKSDLRELPQNQSGHNLAFDSHTGPWVALKSGAWLFPWLAQWPWWVSGAVMEESHFQVQPCTGTLRPSACSADVGPMVCVCCVCVWCVCCIVLCCVLCLYVLCVYCVYMSYVCTFVGYVCVHAFLHACVCALFWFPQCRWLLLNVLVFWGFSCLLLKP